MNRKPYHSVAVLMGGSSSERDISMLSGQAVAGALREAGYDVHPVVVDAHDAFALPPGTEAVFIALHGAFGEDGRLQGYLDMLKRPYTGAGLLGMAAGMDKWVAKLVWASSGIPQVPYVGLTEEAWAREADVLREKVLARYGAEEQA